MSRTYWYKEILSSPVIVNGRAVQWEPLDGNRGVLVVETATHQALADGLKALAAARKGGVVEITEEQMVDKKKALPYNPLKLSAAKQRNMLRAVPGSSDPFRAQASAAVVEPLNQIRPQNAPAPPVEQLGQAPGATQAFRPQTARVGKGKLAQAMQSKLPQ
jgi:hypothetical protein